MRPLFTIDRHAGEPLSPRVLLHHLDGAMDAGHVGALAIEQLLMTLPHERLATFDVDALLDYRARRPVMTFSERSFARVSMPELVLDLFQDDDGEQLLVLHGAEPDYRWEEFGAAVAHLTVSMGVGQAVGLTGIPLAVPHTRPTVIHYHGSKRELLPEQQDFFGTVELPATMGSFLELRLGETGMDSRGLTASVPHYLARDDYPAGAAALLRAAADTTGLALPVGDLEAAASIHRGEIDAEAAEHSEVSAVVAALEAQYDAVAPQSAEGLSDAFDLPSADEIGARLEAFLEANDTGADSEGRPRAEPPGGP
ncbi:PAC2 family protein [Actinomyces oricola]|uniref:PAC2 family protein n=1 Tax=Actinomyces oricola TaxID=206043 RepID=UPI000FFF35EA|nr:PAC2 family protein [Actinomyces oricola]